MHHKMISNTNIKVIMELNVSILLKENMMDRIFNHFIMWPAAQYWGPG